MRNKFPYNCGGSGVVCDDIQNSADESPLCIQRNTNREIRYCTNSKMNNLKCRVFIFNRMKIQKSIHCTDHMTFIFLKQNFDGCICLPRVELSNFTMGTILNKGFCSNTSAESTSAMNCIHQCFLECLSKTLSQSCRHGKIAFSNST